MHISTRATRYTLHSPQSTVLGGHANLDGDEHFAFSDVATVHCALANTDSANIHSMMMNLSNLLVAAETEMHGTDPINTHNLDLITIINRTKYIIIMVLFRTVIGTITINFKLLQRLNENWSIELIVFSLAAVLLFFSFLLNLISRHCMRSTLTQLRSPLGRKFVDLSIVCWYEWPPFSWISWALLSHFVNYYLINNLLNYCMAPKYLPVVVDADDRRLNLVECDYLQRIHIIFLKQLLIPIYLHESISQYIGHKV